MTRGHSWPVGNFVKYTTIETHARHIHQRIETANIPIHPFHQFHHYLFFFDHIKTYFYNNRSNYLEVFIDHTKNDFTIVFDSLTKTGNQFKALLSSKVDTEKRHKISGTSTK